MLKKEKTDLNISHLTNVYMDILNEALLSVVKELNNATFDLAFTSIKKYRSLCKKLSNKHFIPCSLYNMS